MQLITSTDCPSGRNKLLSDPPPRPYEHLPAVVYYQLHQSLLNADNVLLALDSEAGGLAGAVVCTIYIAITDSSLAVSEGEVMSVYRQVEDCARLLIRGICSKHAGQRRDTEEDGSSCESDNDSEVVVL